MPRGPHRKARYGIRAPDAPEKSGTIDTLWFAAIFRLETRWLMFTGFCDRYADQLLKNVLIPCTEARMVSHAGLDLNPNGPWISAI